MRGSSGFDSGWIKSAAGPVEKASLMHEMPVTQSLLNMVLERAEGHRVTDVYLKVGRMSSIMPDSVEVFFDYLSRETLAEGAQLHFEILPLEMTCQNCGQLVPLDAYAGERPHVMMSKAFVRGCTCGSKNLRVTAGVGFELVSIDIEDSTKMVQLL